MVYGALAAGVLALNIGVSAESDDDDDLAILKADTLVAVTGGFVGGASPIRDTAGGGRAWEIRRGKAELDANGTLKISVRGLVIPVSAGGTGTNPVAFFRARVSCLSLDAGGNVVTRHVDTTNGAEVMIGDPHNGDARIRETLTLPSPCVAPIVFVTSAGGAWFAATGM